MKNTYPADSTNNQINHVSEAHLRGKRLKSIRNLLGLSRDTFADRYGIPRGSLQNWETPRFGGLTEKSAHRVIKAFAAEGVECHLNWLLYGIGESPKITNQLYLDVSKKPAVSGTTNNEDDLIAEELLLFRKHYPDTIELIVPDNSMQPRFIAGEYICGRRYYRDQIVQFIGQECIVQLVNGEIILRKLLKGDELQKFNLVCSHPEDCQSNRPFLSNVEIISAAPIIWARRRTN